jgi:membrane-associated phospholipid phosphatase
MQEQRIFLLSYLSYQRRIRRISFVTFVESNAKALLSAAANKNATCKQVLRPAGGLSFPSGHSIIAATTPHFLLIVLNGSVPRTRHLR